MGLGAIPRYPVAVAAMVLAGVGSAVAATNFHGALQSLPPVRLRGRSVAMYLLALCVGAGAGVLVQAWMASWTSVGTGLGAAGVALIVLGVMLTAQRGWIATMAGSGVVVSISQGQAHSENP